MPTYQYRCTTCGHKLEVVQSFSDAPLTECPDCGSLLRKQYGSVGVVFKGSGFYRNDSRAGSGEKAASGEKSTSGKGDGKSDKKADTTSEPKTAATGDKKVEAPAAKTESKPAAGSTSSARKSDSAA